MDPHYLGDKMRGLYETQVKPPLELNFLGWRSDTYQLQRAGWQFAESKWDGNSDPYTRQWKLSMRHPEVGVVGTMTDSHPYYMMLEGHRDGTYSRNRFRIDVILANDIHIYEALPMRFIPVDTRIMYDRDPRESMAHDPYSLMTAPYFSPVGTDQSKDIWLREATMSEIMDLALSKQEPKQEEIRKKMVDRQEMMEYQRKGQEKARLILTD